MSQPELLKKVIETLDGAGIEYMATGSFASSLQGEPRSTHDLDLVIAIPKDKVSILKEAFAAQRYYLDENSMIEAIESNNMFNLIDIDSGDKVDFWILTEDAFDQSRFRRKYREDIMSMRIMVSSPEDTILMKLKWAKLSGGSEKHFTDALRVYEVQYQKLDLNYIGAWAAKLGVDFLLEELQKRAEPL